MPHARRKTTLVVGFSLSIIVLLISSVASYRSVNGLLSSLGWVAHTSEVERELATIISLMKDVETGQRGYLLTGREDFLQPYQQGKDSVWNHFTRAQKLTEDNAQQQRTFDTLKNLLQEKLLLVNITIDQKRTGHDATVDTLEKGKMIMDSIRSVINTMTGREQVLMQERTGKFTSFSANTPVILIVSSLLALVITVLFYRRIRSDYHQNIVLQEELVEKDASLQRKITRIDTIAKEVAKGNYDIRINKDDLE